MSQDLKEESERGRAWSSTFPSQNLPHPQGLVWTCLGSPGNLPRNSGTQNTQGWQAKSSEALKSPWDTGGLGSEERPGAQPFPCFPRPQPLSASTPATWWERQVAGGPSRQWAAFTVALVSGSPMSRLLRAIKIIGANANSGGQPEAQRGAGTQREAKAQSDSSNFSPSS